MPVNARLAHVLDALPPAPDPDPRVTLTDMLATGASYRQLDHWWRSGYFAPPQTRAAREVPPRPGSGVARRWTPRHRQIADAMVRLSRVGIVGATAAGIARAAVDDGVHTATRDGVTITLDVA